MTTTNSILETCYSRYEKYNAVKMNTEIFNRGFIELELYSDNVFKPYSQVWNLSLPDRLLQILRVWWCDCLIIQLIQLAFLVGEVCIFWRNVEAPAITMVIAENECRCEWYEWEKVLIRSQVFDGISTS